MMKFQESPGGENVISHLLPPALTMRSDSVSFAVMYTPGCWRLDGTTCARDFVLCVPAEHQAAADTETVTECRMLLWHCTSDNETYQIYFMLTFVYL